MRSIKNINTKVTIKVNKKCHYNENYFLVATMAMWLAGKSGIPRVPSSILTNITYFRTLNHSHYFSTVTITRKNMVKSDTPERADNAAYNNGVINQCYLKPS